MATPLPHLRRAARRARVYLLAALGVLALAATLALTAPPASAATNANRRAAWVETAPPVPPPVPPPVSASGPASGPASAPASSAVPKQADCGWVTCTVRLSRDLTRQARDLGRLLQIGATLCARFSGLVGAICWGAVLPAASLLAEFASRYYNNGNCLGMRFNLLGPAAWPVEVRRGTYDCY